MTFNATFRLLRPAAAAAVALFMAGAAHAQTAEEFRGNLDDSTSPAYCGQCHTRIYEEWSDSWMGTDLTNDVVYQFYTSTNSAGKFDGLGFKGFNKAMGHGDEAGDCADCHVPRQVIQAHERGEKDIDLGQAMDNVADHGIACSFCHAVTEVNLEKGADGRYAERIWDKVKLEQNEDTWHGPFETDEAAHDVVQSDIYRSSEICGVCHLNQEKFVSISTYQDWKIAFDAGLTNQTCQGCHMPLIEGAVSVAEGGPEREGMRRHTFLGARDAGMRAKALSLDLDAQVVDGKLVVKTVVENVGAGHTVPGSSPIRNVILKIEATDANGNPLEYAGDKRGLLPPLAGFGNPATGQHGPQDWAGMPGRMYAKVYRSVVVPKLGKPMVGVGGFAADSVVFDTLLQPKKPDAGQWTFDLPAGGGEVTVTARVVYRWAFMPIAARKGWKMADLPMTEASLSVQTPQ